MLTICLTLTVSGAYDAERLTEKTNAADFTEQTYASLRIQSGDTLWEIAKARTAPGGDIRVTIEKICDINGITASTLRAGDEILVPEML